ncbi:hypothetical protein TCAL_07891, partial [Tigriopus californicus]
LQGSAEPLHKARRADKRDRSLVSRWQHQPSFQVHVRQSWEQAKTAKEETQREKEKEGKKINDRGFKTPLPAAYVIHHNHEGSQAWIWKPIN